jgi:Protein of unknown function (DUF2516)
MLSFDGLVLLVLYAGAQGLTLWAFVDALIRPATGFVASGKLTKPAWMGITGLAALLIFWQQNPMTLFGLPAVIAAIVYLVDVRPAVRGLPRGNSW